MKIGLLSFQKNPNYGWILQCYALMTILKKQGFDVVYIDRYNLRPIGFNLIFRKIKYFFKTMLTSGIKGFSFNKLEKEKYNKKAININDFFNRYIEPRTRPIYKKKDLYNCNLLGLDAYIVGSDQVWRPCFHSPLSNMFFDFVTDSKVKLYSYAASFGVAEKEYTKKQIITCGNLVKRFSAISLRESSGINIFKNINHWEGNPIHVLDPTMLLDKRDYEKLYKIKADDLDSQKQLFCYILDEEKDKKICIDTIMRNFKYSLVKIKLDEEILPSVETWLNSFDKAKFVFTDSFHGCVFSIIYKKPFVVYGNSRRGLSRITSLLAMFGLENRLIQDSSSLEMVLNEPIDWIKVSMKMEQYKKKSLNFLQEIC